MKGKDEVFRLVPKNSSGGYNSVVVVMANKIEFQGSRDDFFSLTGISQGHFLAMAKRKKQKELVRFLLDHGYKKEE